MASDESAAVAELHRHIAERVASEVALYENFRAASRGDETSDGLSWNPPAEVTLPRVVDQLHRHLAAHVPAETSLIASYRQLAERDDIPEEVRYLLRILVKDEENHHQFFKDIANAFGDEVPEHHEPTAVKLPDLPPAQLLKQVTRDFLAAERADQRQLRALHKELRPLANRNLWALLVELMQLDNQKHIHLLKYIRHHIDELTAASQHH